MKVIIKNVKNRLSLSILLGLTALMPLQGMQYAHSLWKATKNYSGKTIELIKEYPVTSLTAGALSIGLTHYYQQYQFCKKHRPPEELCNLIEQHKDLIYEKISDSWRGVIEIPEIPEFFIKKDPMRIVYAEFVHDCIQQYNLDCLDVPKKYIYNVKGKWLVFAEKVQEYKENGLFQGDIHKERSQLRTLIEKTDYCDAHHGNLIRNNQGKNFIIDTENRSFNWRKTETFLPTLKRMYHSFSTLTFASLDELLIK